MDLVKASIEQLKQLKKMKSAVYLFYLNIKEEDMEI